MPIPLKCECGRALKVKDELAGRKVRCPVCKVVVQVPSIQKPEDVEEEVLDVLLTESPPKVALTKSKPQNDDESSEEQYGIQPPPKAPRRPPPVSVDRPPAEGSRRRSVARANNKRRESGWGIAIHPQIITGLLMMGGAAVWFLGGLYLGIIWFYPPILFVLGIAAVIKGFTGRE